MSGTAHAAPGEAPVDDLSPAAVAAGDPSGMMEDVLDLPAQLEDALWRVESAAVPRQQAAEGLVVCGMGGSAVGGELAAAAAGGRAHRPLRIVREYDLPPWVGREALVLCSSYSGDTEETLASFAAAGRLGARRVVLGTGGRLVDCARAEGVPVIGVPSGFQPRASVAYTTVAALECAAACGAVEPLGDEVRAAGPLLEALCGEWGPGAPPASEAKALARRLAATVPVLYGAEATVAPARRWKAQINENAKLPAFASAVPEADHNELIGYEGAPGLAPLHAVFLADRAQRPQVRRRLELTAEAVAEAGAVGVDMVEARGETPIERLLSLVLLGDLVSVYLAVLRRVDPTPVDALTRFKERVREP